MVEEMVDEPRRYLTAKETADRLRVAPQTVYRWCRAGRLETLKVGREWRILAEQVEGKHNLAGVMALDALLAGLTRESEHLVGLAGDKLALARMEAIFFDVAAASGGRLVHARWEENAAEVRRRLRPALTNARKDGGALHLLEFRRAYEKAELAGPARLLLREFQRAGADGKPCYAYGSPYPYFGYHLVRLTTFESGMDEHIRGQAALVLCGYALNDLCSLYQGRAASLIMELMNCHSGVIWFDGQRALLQRPAGWMG